MDTDQHGSRVSLTWHRHGSTLVCPGSPGTEELGALGSGHCRDWQPWTLGTAVTWSTGGGTGPGFPFPPPDAPSWLLPSSAWAMPECPYIHWTPSDPGDTPDPPSIPSHLHSVPSPGTPRACGAFAREGAGARGGSGAGGCGSVGPCCGSVGLDGFLSRVSALPCDAVLAGLSHGRDSPAAPGPAPPGGATGGGPAGAGACPGERPRGGCPPEGRPQGVPQGEGARLLPGHEAEG